jgi:hypothetical protein
MVAREGIEPPTRGFSAASRGFQGFINQHLQASCRPFPGSPRHTPGTVNLSWSHLRHSWLVDRDAPRPRNARQIPMASWPRPCRLPRRKSVFRAYAPRLGQYVRHAASLDRHRRQSSPASWAIFVEWSWSALHQSRFSFGILIYCPVIRQRLIHIEEIGPSALESPYHIGSRDIVAPLSHSARDPT